MQKLIEKMKNKFKKHFKHVTENIRWKSKYNTLLKEHEKAKQKIEELEKKLDVDTNIKKINDKDKLIIALRKQNDNLKKDIKKLMNK